MIGQPVGHYKVVRKIGDGGMGSVFEAVHETIGRRVAIKVLKPQYSKDKNVVTRFFNEARAVNIVSHPGVVGSFDYGEMPDGTAYIVMEYLEGESLVTDQADRGTDGLRRAPHRSPDRCRPRRRPQQRNHSQRNYIISIVCFHVGHLGPQRRRNKPCPLTVPRQQQAPLTSHQYVIQITTSESLVRRVSTDMQVQHGLSLDAQRAEIERYAADRGWIVEEFFVDGGFSAKNTDRPAFQRMARNQDDGAIAAVLVTKLDRFTRSLRDLCNIGFARAVLLQSGGNPRRHQHV